MRVLIICDYSLLYLGGAQIALMRQADALAAAGHEVSLLGPNAGAVTMDERITAIEPPHGLVLPCLDFPLLRVGDPLRRFVDALLAVGRFDLVILHSEFAL